MSRRRLLAGSLAAASFLVILALVAVFSRVVPSGGSPDVGPPAAGEETTAEAPARGLAADSGAPTSSAGHVLKEIGEPAVIVDSVDGEVIFSLTISDIEVRPDCPGAFAQAPENGNYVVVTIDASFSAAAVDRIPGTAESGDVLMFLGPAMFSVVDESGAIHSSLETDAAWTCYETRERAAYTIAPGEEVVGLVVLDSPVASGTLVYRPVGNGGWQWAF